MNLSIYILCYLQNVVKSKNLNVSISDNTKPLDSKLVAASSDELNEVNE